MYSFYLFRFFIYFYLFFDRLNCSIAAWLLSGLESHHKAASRTENYANYGDRRRDGEPIGCRRSRACVHVSRRLIVTSCFLINFDCSPLRWKSRLFWANVVTAKWWWGFSLPQTSKKSPHGRWFISTNRCGNEVVWRKTKKKQPKKRNSDEWPMCQDIRLHPSGVLFCFF